MAESILSNLRSAAEQSGYVVLDTMQGVAITNPIVVGSRFIAELRARGFLIVPAQRDDGIYRRDRVTT